MNPALDSSHIYHSIDVSRCRVSARPYAGVVLLLAVDVLSLWLAIAASVALWTLTVTPVALQNYFMIPPTVGAYLLVYAKLGLYRGVAPSAVEEFRAIVHGTTLVSLILPAFGFLTRDLDIYSRGVFLLSWLMAVAFVPLARSWVREMFCGRSWWGTPALIIGAGGTAELFLRNLAKQPSLGLKPVACVDDSWFLNPDCAGVPVVGPLSSAVDLASRLNIRYAVIAVSDPERQSRLLQTLGHESPFRHTVILPNVCGTGTVWVEPKDFNGTLGLELRHNLLVPANRWLKRAIDVMFALTMGVLALPIIAVAAACIRILSPGPVFYSQTRTGKGGRPIRVWKLRTMYLNAEELLKKKLEEDLHAQAEWHRFFKLKNDPRILPGIGKVLRLTSLDELPQLWNVLVGEMSLVGPRPFPEYHIRAFGEDFRELREKVMPGLTGLWQISARSDGDLKVQESLDTYYIRNWSLWLDMWILFRTIAVVIARKGAY
jgi:Undecaprenyl-phosphate galactose phosphotransferase WbaP